MADDEGMTVRERRARHAKEQARKDAPSKVARKAIVPAIVILVLAGIATGFYFESKQKSDCPGHFHATFAIYIPGDSGQPELVDFASPVSPTTGGHYYDLSNKASRQTVGTHMHQSGAEQGSTALGPTQLHFEAPGKCVPFEDSLRAIDVMATSKSVKLEGGHEQVGQSGTWREEGNQTLRFFLQTKQGDEWVWAERSLGPYLDEQIQDGESFLLAFGNYTDEQVAQMQQGVPPPISRVFGEQPPSHST